MLLTVPAQDLEFDAEYLDQKSAIQLFREFRPNNFDVASRADDVQTALINEKLCAETGKFAAERELIKPSFVRTDLARKTTSSVPTPLY